MASYVHTGAITGASIGGSNPVVAIRSILVTAAAAAATVTVYSNGVAAIILTCPANDSRVYAAVSGGNQFSLEQLTGPVTIDVTGVGAFVRVSY